jgi:hypothetical protein
MTATDDRQPGAGQASAASNKPDEFDYDNITSLSSDSCARPGGRSNYTPPISKKADDEATDEAGFDGYDDNAGGGPENLAPKKFADTGFDGYDDDAKGPATISLIGGADSNSAGDDGGDWDDRPAA